MPWSASFEDSIVLPNGRKLLTLKDAADNITGLPKKESDLPEWQTAIEVLLLCSRGGPTMMARIGVMSAEPSRRAGVQSGSKGPALGQAQAEKRPMINEKLPPEPEWRGVSGLRIIIPHGRPDVMLVEIKTLYGRVDAEERCAERRPVDHSRSRKAGAHTDPFPRDAGP